MRSSTLAHKTGRRPAARFKMLADRGIVATTDLVRAERTALARGIELEQVLVRELGIAKHTVLAALAEHYGCSIAEYDERLPVPAELLERLDPERMTFARWFPIISENGTVVIAVHDPADPVMADETARQFPGRRLEFRVAFDEDIQWYIQDFLHARPGALIGTERTGLAYWRNTMAHWRTKLACYRTDLAQGRTDLAYLRWGLGLIALADVLTHTRPDAGGLVPVTALMTLAGAGLAVFGLKGYLAVRKVRMRAPGHHTLVEVTSATLAFLESFHDPGLCDLERSSEGTMLARLGACIGGYSSILVPQPASRERTHLARERNVLAAQRTVAACYRTIYARARTGLAFMRTGVSFISAGIALVHFFPYGWWTAADGVLIVSGMLMTMDGLLWYLPVRKEQAEVPRCEG